MSVTSTTPRPDFSPYEIETSWIKDAPARRTVLVVYAHPDDESFGNGGTLVRYAAEGVAVHYACATRGECGTIDPKFLVGYADAAALRTAELECAARALGLSAVHYLNYRDSGMPGTPDNSNPKAFEQAPFDHVVGQLVALIRTLQPQVILTFGPYGGYGHPDHIKANRTTEAAFQRSADPTCYPEQIAAGLSPWTPQRLYYTTFGPRFLKIVVRLIGLVGRDPRKFGTNHDVDLAEALNQITPVTTVIDARRYIVQADQARLCHRSQFGGPFALLVKIPVALRRFFTGKESFTRAIPTWPSGPVETDLFGGV